MKTNHFSKLFIFAILATLTVFASPSVRASLRLAESNTKVEDTRTPAEAPAATTDIEIGNPNAPITIHEYSSLSCQHCAMFQKDVFPLIESQYVKPGKVRIVFHHFPLDKQAFQAAMLVSCRPAANRMQALNVVFNNQHKWLKHDKVNAIAEAAGVMDADAEKCIADEAKLNFMLSKQQYASRILSINATPTLVISKTGSKLSTTIIQGVSSFEEISAQIDKVLASSASPTLS